MTCNTQEITVDDLMVLSGLKLYGYISADSARGVRVNWHSLALTADDAGVMVARAPWPVTLASALRITGSA